MRSAWLKFYQVFLNRNILNTLNGPVPIGTVVPLALRDCWSPFSNKLTLLWSYDLLNLMKNIKVQSHNGATDTVVRQVPVARRSRGR